MSDGKQRLGEPLTGKRVVKEAAPAPVIGGA
jgi:hypothetical protein